MSEIKQQPEEEGGRRAPVPDDAARPAETAPESASASGAASQQQGAAAPPLPTPGIPASADAGTPQTPTPPDPEELEIWNQQVRRRMRRQTRRSFLGLAAGAGAGFGAWKWLTSRRELDGLPWPLRKGLETNEQWARDYFRSCRLAPTYAPGRVTSERVNGDLGLEEDVPEGWNLEVAGLAAGIEPQHLGLDAIKKLPRREMTTELKCIEGWSVLVRWAGARFTDFMQAYPPQTVSGGAFRLDRAEDLPPYVGMETPDGGYYVGLDMESMLHPQTLLCYEMNGSPLTDEHGAPLRLVIPVKYGVKNLKRIGRIEYTMQRPSDYWAEQGYDWYIGL